MTTATSNIYDVVSQMSDGQVETFHNVTWDEYEELLDQVGEARGLRISYNEGTLKVMSLSLEHERYTDFIKALVLQIRFRLRIDIRSSGSATMRKEEKSKGNEPDASYYIQTASAIGNRFDVDFTVNPPDLVIEVDIHHGSTGNDPIYAALGVPEIWRYDGWKVTILHLQGDGYVEADAGRSLSMITSDILNEYLSRMERDGELKAILAFDEWLQSLQP